MSIEFISDGTTTWIYGEKKETLEKLREILDIRTNAQIFMSFTKPLGTSFVIAYLITSFVIT